VQKACKSQFSDILSAPLELAKTKIDSAICEYAGVDDPVAVLKVASSPCLADSTSDDCTKHWAAHYMSRAARGAQNATGPQGFRRPPCARRDAGSAESTAKGQILCSGKKFNR